MSADYYCKDCKQQCSTKSGFTKHLNSKKHRDQLQRNEPPAASKQSLARIFNSISSSTQTIPKRSKNPNPVEDSESEVQDSSDDPYNSSESGSESSSSSDDISKEKAITDH